MPPAGNSLNFQPLASGAPIWHSQWRTVYLRVPLSIFNARATGLHRVHCYQDGGSSAVDTAAFCTMAEVTDFKSLLCHTNYGLGHGRRGPNGAPCWDIKMTSAVHKLVTQCGYCAAFTGKSVTNSPGNLYGSPLYLLRRRGVFACVCVSYFNLVQSYRTSIGSWKGEEIGM